jgi:SAM-dependent methyltransferase
VTLPLSYFDELYRQSPDPWGFGSRWYEERKRAVTLAALPERSYHLAYEPGCSIGVLSRDLARRCRSLLASDASAYAVARAVQRLEAVPNVRVERRVLPHDWPAGHFDLVVLSEILYYFDQRDLAEVTRKAVHSVAPGGTLLSVHWRHPVEAYPLTGDEAQASIVNAAGRRLVETVRHVEEDFSLVVLVRPGEGESSSSLSVAHRAGLC